MTSPANSELQERIARAIYEGTPRNCPWTSLSLHKKQKHRAEALAAMKAVREPTDGMVTAGGEYVLNVGGIDPMHLDDRGPPFNIKGRETGSYELWRAMIDTEIAFAEGCDPAER